MASAARSHAMIVRIRTNEVILSRKNPRPNKKGQEIFVAIYVILCYSNRGAAGTTAGGFPRRFPSGVNFFFYPQSIKRGGGRYECYMV